MGAAASAASATSGGLSSAIETPECITADGGASQPAETNSSSDAANEDSAESEPVSTDTDGENTRSMAPIREPELFERECALPLLVPALPPGLLLVLLALPPLLVLMLVVICTDARDILATSAVKRGAQAMKRSRSDCAAPNFSERTMNLNHNTVAQIAMPFILPSHPLPGAQPRETSVPARAA